MLSQAIRYLGVTTRGRGFYEITREVAVAVRDTGWKTGLATLLLRHTPASLLIQENADPEVRRDLERLLARLAPDGDPLGGGLGFEDDLQPRQLPVLAPGHQRQGRLTAPDAARWQVTGPRGRYRAV